MDKIFVHNEYIDQKGSSRMATSFHPKVTVPRTPSPWFPSAITRMAPKENRISKYPFGKILFSFFLTGLRRRCNRVPVKEISVLALVVQSVYLVLGKENSI
jgi:hypothetical protein